MGGGNTQSAAAGQASGGTGGAAAVKVQGATLTEKLEWLEENARRNTGYLVEVTANETITPKTLSYQGRNNIEITIVGIGGFGIGGARTLSLSGSGTYFTVENGVTLELAKITLQGRDRNTGPLVMINKGGALIMSDGAKFTGNSNTTYSNNTAGVYIGANSSFRMKGGEICSNSGRGVYVGENASFIMEGGEIYGNATNGEGGGVYAYGSFIMRGGEIYGNTSANGGGGVYVSGSKTTFTMSGGEISGNTVNGRDGAGGGVKVFGGSFIMEDGEIFGNKAHSGGGVWVVTYGSFAKNGGTIYGFTEGDKKSNTATGGVNRGHAVLVIEGSTKTRGLRNVTAGPRVKLDSKTTGGAGNWEN